MPYITRIVVTELEPDTVSPEPWLVQWEGRGGDQRQRHDSKAAARQHVSGLLAEIAPGLSRDQVLTVNERD
jgi:hypothetical protein